MTEQAGTWTRGILDAAGIPLKEIAAQSGIHPSTLSRFFNGVKKINERQYGLLCIAIGEARARRLQAKRT